MASINSSDVRSDVIDLTEDEDNVDLTVDNPRPPPPNLPPPKGTYWSVKSSASTKSNKSKQGGEDVESMDDSFMDDSTIKTQDYMDASMDGVMGMDKEVTDKEVFIEGIVGVGGGGDSMMDTKSTAKSKALSKAKSSSRSVSTEVIAGEVKFPYPPTTMALMMEWRADNMELDPGRTRLPKMPGMYKQMVKDETLEMARKSGNRSLVETVGGWTPKKWGERFKDISKEVIEPHGQRQQKSKTKQTMYQEWVCAILWLQRTTL